MVKAHCTVAVQYKSVYMSCTTACLCATVVVGVVAVLPWDRCCAARGTPPRADTPPERAIRDEMAPSLKPQLLEAASLTRTTQNTGIIFTSLLLLLTALATVASGLEPVVSVAGVGTTAVAGLLLPGGVAAQSVDLLAALALHNTTRQGVSRTTGPQDLRPAYYLQGDYRDLRLPSNTFQRVVELLRTNPEFTFAAWLRQDETNSGSIVSFSHGNNRYLELQSSGRKDEIRLHYTSQHDATVHVETFPYRLADNAWHQLAVSVSGAQVELLVDCHPVYRRVLRLGAPDRNLTQAIPPLQLWVGQRNNRHSLFKGSLQDVRVIMGPHGYLAQCPHLNSTCPTCGQFSLLQSTVQELTRHLHELSERLVAAEGRIGRVEQCDCQKSCRLNGTAHGDGTTWKRDCDMCSCVHGEVECRPVQCPKITCKNPVINPGDCCPTCLKQCYLRGVLYDHGEQVALKQCVECECKDGSMQCKRINPDTMCPQLQCPPEKQFSVPGECCKFCPDVDECKQEGGLEGHHCQSNTKCVNTPGSYVCECLTGYRRIDKFNCAELDECSTGEHGCDLHANCVNTQGSYHCVCQQGYTGDGYHCKPICNQTCLNGGECVSPNKCSCRKGYIGPSCELDLDECANGLHRCHPASVCVNMPGWYYCKCKHGYRSILRDNTLGTLCQDIDECKEGTHTCHPSARCINTDGGFRCACTEDQAPGCKLSCMFEGAEVAHGQTVPPAGQPCRLCECNHGVITCQDPKCDCSVRGSETNKCCPQCDPNAVCTHQELRQVVFRSGERWIYQCQTCECLSGQVDCWDMDCPPLTCSDPVLTPGDCCPRCDNDPCSFDADDNSTSSGQPCTYAGRLYDSGTQWTDPDDRCTSCNCKDGRLCCSFDFRCGDVGRPVGYDGVVAGTSGIPAQFNQATVSNANSGSSTPSTGASASASASANPNPNGMGMAMGRRFSSTTTTTTTTATTSTTQPIIKKDTVPGHYSSGFISVHNNSSKTLQTFNNNTKQYSAAVRVDSVANDSPVSSAKSDFETPNKTEKETANTDSNQRTNPNTNHIKNHRNKNNDATSAGDDSFESSTSQQGAG